MVMRGLLIMQSQRLMQFGVLFARFLKHDAEIVQSLLFIQIFNYHKGCILFIDNLVFSLFQKPYNQTNFPEI